MNTATIIFGVIGVVGTAITVIGYMSRSYHQLAYYLSEPALVIDNAQPVSSIQVLDADGKRVEGSVYTSKLVIWNSGTETIYYEEVLEPVKVSNPSIERILDHPPTDFVREERANFDVPSSSGDSKSFDLQWEKFDPGAAIEIQVVFESLPRQVHMQGGGFQVNGELVKGKLVWGTKHVGRSERYLQHVIPICLLIGLSIRGFYTLVIKWPVYLEYHLDNSSDYKVTKTWIIRSSTTLLTLCFLAFIIYAASTIPDSIRTVFQPSLISPF